MALFGSKSSPQPTVVSTVKVDLAADGLVRFHLAGDIDGPLIQRGTDQLRPLIKGKRIRIVLIDGTAINKIEASMRAPTSELLAVMKTAGITMALIATSSSVVRLMATTLGLATSFKIELFDTTELAMRRAQAVLKVGHKEA
jgi:hypothetical protein